MRITSSTSTRDNTPPSTTKTTTTTASPTLHKQEILSKCAKMTEGEHRIHGMNGASDNGNGSANAGAAGAAGALIVKQEKTDGDGTSVSGGQADTYNNLGGRLKFFKNGRFILELARAREGEKVAWVPVPKKTFWPPPGSTSSLSTYRQESSTSLSVSDDNSSIQSSPWQRDHTWKQTSPQRNISSNLNFYFMNRKKRTTTTSKCCQYKLQRCPYLILTDEQRTKCGSQTKCNNIKCININVKLNNSAICLRKTLVNVVEFLWNKTLQTFNSITSPRKRILRELERVTIDDDLSIYNKRCRGKINAKTTQHSNNININMNTNISNNNSGSGSGSASNGLIINGCEEKQTQRNSSNSGKNCSYSITSLLGDENKTDKTLSSSSSTSTSSQSNKNMIEIHLKKRQESPPSQHYNYMSAPPTPTPTPTPTQFMSPYPIYSSVLHHHPATVTTTTSATAAAVNYISPYYHHPHPPHPHHHHHGAAYGAVRPSAFYQPPLMTQPIGPRHEAYSSPWNTYEQHLPLHRDDSSDVPLNLSKHAD